MTGDRGKGDNHHARMMRPSRSFSFTIFLTITVSTVFWGTCCSHGIWDSNKYLTPAPRWARCTPIIGRLQGQRHPHWNPERCHPCV